MMQKGFTLIEILISISITLVIGVAVFQLFHQNERVFNDQNLLTEMEQAARAAIFQTADEIRMAGQGVPTYAETYADTSSEDTVAILSGSSATRINFRAGLAPAETSTIATGPITFSVGNPMSVTVDDAVGLYNAVGGGPTGRFVYFSGASDTLGWLWVRASINSITPSIKSVGVTPVSTGPAGNAGGTVEFQASPTMSLEEVIAIYQDSFSGSMRRTTATSMSDPVHPSWAPANELSSNVTLLRFDYFDRFGNIVIPDTLANRARIERVEIRLAVHTAQELTNHSRQNFALSVRTNIRNARIR
jgi:prepilin-type N-terminal cleavage/methylation domain-containing protein